MTTVGACGLATCPVPTPTAARLRRLRSVALPIRTPLRRGVKIGHPDATELVPAVGDTRFGPIAGIGHAYVATTTFAALLESAFHEAAPPAPRLYEAQLATWAEEAVELACDVRLIDLRDDELDRIGLDRAQLVATTAAHYPCTRVWAEALHGRSVGGHKTYGLLWNSRQTELHAAAAADRPALQELIDEHPAEVAVLWAPPAPADVLAAAGGGLGPLDAGAGRAYTDDLVALLGIVTP